MAITTAEIQDQNRSEIPTQTSTNTPWGNLIMKCCATNQNINIPAGICLNERYNRLASESIGVKNARRWELKGFMIGIRGSDADGTTSLGTTRLKVNQHQPIDASLFVPIPFLVRRLTAPLTNLERSKFRMRTVQKLLDGFDYEVWWIKLTSFARYNPTVNKVTRDAAGNEGAVPYIPDPKDLMNPQPVDFTSSGTVPIADQYINSSAIYDCSLERQDLVEIANACKLMFGDTSYGSINETAAVWGIDTTTTGPVTGGATISYTEFMSAIIGHFMTERDGRNVVNNTKVNLAYDHGASEPMLLHTNSTSTTSAQGN